MAVTNNLTTIHSCETVTDGVTSAVLTSTGAGNFLTGGGEFIEGSAAYGFDLDIETHTVTFTPTASLNLSASAVWIWLKFLTAGYLDTWASGGVLCRLDDGTNWSEWYLAGSDRASSVWTRFVFSTSSTPDAVSGTLNLAAVTTVVFYFTGLVKSKLPENVIIDYLQYGSDGTGMTITGGTVGTPETFADVVGDDTTAAVGMLAETDGVFFMNGPLEFGDSGGTGDTYLADSNQLLASVSHYRTFTTANRGTAESLVSSTHNTLSVVGNGTGTTSFVLGSKTGSLGYAGCTLKTGGTARIIFTCTDTDVDTMQLYGCTLITCGAISLPVVSGTAREVVSTSFNACNQIDPSTCLVTNCVIADSADAATGALLLDTSGASGLTDLVFISGGSGHAIYIPNLATGSYTFVGFTYNGYGITTSADASVYNNSAGAVTLNINGGDSPTYLDGTSASTSVVNAKTLTITTVDANAAVIAGVRVRIEETDGTLVTQGETDVAGEYEITDYNYLGDLAVVVKARLKGYKNFRTSGLIDNNGLTATATMQRDRIVDLP